MVRLIGIHAGRSHPCAFISIVGVIGVFLFLPGCLPSEGTDQPSLPVGTTNLSKNGSVSFAPDIASNGEIVYVVWTDIIGDNQEIVLVRSGDGGQTFSETMNVSETLDPSINAQIAVSGTTVYIVWEEFLSEQAESDIFFRKAEDSNGGLNWSSKKNISLSGPVCNDSIGPAMDPCPSQFPALAADGERILVAWSESVVYEFKEITIEESTGRDFIHVVADIFMLGSSDRGESFQPLGMPPSLSISNKGNSRSLNPALAAAPGTFYVAWTDLDTVPPNNQPEHSEIFFRSSDGSVLTPPIGSSETILSSPIRGSGSPDLAAGDGNTYLVWEGTPAEAGSCQFGSDIFLVKSTDGFATVIGLPTNISNSACRANNGNVSAFGNKVYIVWEDNAPGRSGLLFRMSQDGGDSFSEAAHLNNTSGSVAAPAVSAQENGLFAVWEDALLGNLEIFFSKL